MAFWTGRRINPNSGEDGPSAEEVDWRCCIFYSRMISGQKSKNVEHVVSVIGQSKRVHDGVKMDSCQHQRNNPQSREKPRKSVSIVESIVEELWKITAGYNNIGNADDHQWPREEDKVWPDVQHLRNMDSSAMELLMPQNDAAIPEHESAKCC